MGQVVICWVPGRRTMLVSAPQNNMYNCYFSALNIVISEEKKTHFSQVLPVFRAFPVQGTIITSRAVAREVMMGPTDRKCPKNG